MWKEKNKQRPDNSHISKVGIWEAPESCEVPIAENWQEWCFNGSFITASWLFKDVIPTVVKHDTTRSQNSWTVKIVVWTWLLAQCSLTLVLVLYLLPFPGNCLPRGTMLCNSTISIHDEPHSEVLPLSGLSSSDPGWFCSPSFFWWT